MRVAVDVDGVLADIISTWIIVYDLPFSKQQVTDWDFKNLACYGVTVDKFMEAHNKLWEIGVVRPETKNLKDKVPNIDFDIVTARPRGGIDDVRLWLAKHDIRYGKLIQVKRAKDKPALNYDVYIDDYPRMHEHLEDDQIQIMISQPWNLLVSHPQVKRAVNLEHASYILQGLSK